MTIVHPELVAAMTTEIAASGPIPFVRFMELALYHPQYGYYMRTPESGAALGTHLKLFPWAYRFVDEGRVTGERFDGVWENLGTPAQLADLDRRLRR